MISVKGSYIQTNTSGLETDDHHFRALRALFEFRDHCTPLLYIHGTVKAVLIKPISLKGDLNEIQETRELRENHSSKQRILVP